jgi:hypothetical protein
MWIKYDNCRRTKFGYGKSKPFMLLQAIAVESSERSLQTDYILKVRRAKTYNLVLKANN